MNQIFARLRTIEPLTKLHPGDAPSAPWEKLRPVEATAEPARRALDQVTAQDDPLRDSGKIVHLYGSLFIKVPDKSGSQIQVDRIELEG